MNRKILIFVLRKRTIIRKIPRIRLILRIRIFVNTGPGMEAYKGYVEKNEVVITTYLNFFLKTTTILSCNYDLHKS